MTYKELRKRLAAEISSEDDRNDFELADDILAIVAEALREPSEERVAGAICKSGKFETGQGTCAVRCMDQLGEARKGPCRHAFKVHNDLARAALAAIAEEDDR